MPFPLLNRKKNITDYALQYSPRLIPSSGYGMIGVSIGVAAIGTGCALFCTGFSGGGVQRVNQLR